MTPAQITAVEETLASIDVEVLARDFYQHAFDADPALTSMFTSDPAIQRTRFAAELAQIVRSIGSLDSFIATTRSLGVSHRDFGVRPAHYRLMGEALLETLASTLGEAWTDDVKEGWALAYNLTAETMMLGAMESPS